MVRGHETREAARIALVEGWDGVRQARPQASQVMLAHTRVDVAELNQLARGRMRAAGELSEDQVLATERGERAFAVGDRLMFLRNERSMGVKNGSLGTIERIEPHRGGPHGGGGASLTVRLDGDRTRRGAPRGPVRPEGLRPHRPRLRRDDTQEPRCHRRSRPSAGDQRP